MGLPSPDLHYLCCDVPSVRRDVQHLADVGDVRQDCFTRCRWRSRFWAVFGARRTCRPVRGRRLLASCPQAELARKNALHQGEEVGHDIAHGAALAACLQLVEYFLALLRRQGAEVNELSYGNTALDLSSGTLVCGEKQLRLSAREFDVMRYLLQMKGQNVSKEAILARVWGFDSNAVENHVEVYVGFLRKKLKAIGSNVHIEAARRLGYHLEVEGA